MDKVPVWVRLVGLDVKYWGKAALTKIASLIGSFLRVDRAITNKERLTYARILSTMPLNQAYPSGVMFENKVGKIVSQKVEYE